MVFCRQPRCPEHAAGAHLLGRIGGWAILAQRYRVSSPAPASVKRGVSGRVGSLSYRNNLVVGIDDHGLYLAPMLPFRLGHAPLRISWSALQAQQRPTAEPAQIQLMIRDVATVPVQLPARVQAPAQAWLPEPNRVRLTPAYPGG